jgi:pimeloyl-ACP methyl ester carboxylesterase
MATEVILPRVDMDMTTGRISRWYIEEGATVEKGQPLFEIETDKAAMEIEAPNSGILRKLPAPENADIPVGSTVGWIYGEGEAIAPAAASPAPVALPGVVTATPLARRLARQYDIALADIAGSGPRCRVQARDVENAAKTAPAVETPTPPAPFVFTHEAALHRIWLRRGEGRPLVLVHGFGADHSTWRPLVGSLTTERPILAVDLPGHGQSPAASAPSLAGFAAAVAEAIAAEGIAAADLIGHSLGAAVITQLADGAAFDLRSLFLIAPAGLGPDISGAFLAGFLRARSEESLGPWLRLLVSDEASLGQGFVKATLRAREGKDLVTAQEAVARALFPDGTQAFSIQDILARLDIPVRVVVGTEDRIIPAHDAAGLPGHVAVHRFRGVGHMPHVEIRPSLARILSHHLHE